MRLPLVLALLLAALPARADVAQAVDQMVLPGIAGFAAAARELAAAARDDCTAPALEAPYQAAFDAWLRVADLRLGPSESRGFNIGFWPDERGAGRRVLAGLIASQDPAGTDPAALAQLSVAARGLFALDLLLHEPDFAYDAGSYTCRLAASVTADLAGEAAVLLAEWQEHARLLATPGAPGNAAYLTRAEAMGALYTQVLAGLDFTADSRIGRPLGTFDRPRPTRAEAWRSGRPLADVVIAARAARDLAAALAGGPLPRTDAALAQVQAAADRILDPAFQDLADSGAWLRLEILQERIRALKQAIEDEVGAGLSLAPGFNAQDGD